MSNAEMVEMASFMKSFVNPLRLKILDCLNGSEKPVNQIVRETGAKQCYVSQQLIFLTQKNILNRRVDYRNVFYSLKMKHVHDMLEMVRIGL